MSLREPTNKNFFNASHYTVFIDKLPNVSFFLQETAIPTINIQGAKRPTLFTDYDEPGEKMTWEPLNLTFKIDENLGNYMEIVTWMIAIGRPDNFDDYKKLLEESKFIHRPGIGGLFSDVELTLQTSNFNPLYKFKFLDCWPMRITDLPLTVTNNDVEFVTATVTMAYTRYVPIKL